MLQKKKEGKGHKDVMDLSFRVQIQTKKEARNAENTEITKNKNKTKEYSCSVCAFVWIIKKSIICLQKAKKNKKASERQCQPTAHVSVFVGVVPAVVLAVADPRVQLAQRVVADELVSTAKEGA